MLIRWSCLSGSKTGLGDFYFLGFSAALTITMTLIGGPLLAKNFDSIEEVMKVEKTVEQIKEVCPFLDLDQRVLSSERMVESFLTGLDRFERNLRNNYEQDQQTDLPLSLDERKQFLLFRCVSYLELAQRRCLESDQTEFQAIAYCRSISEHQKYFSGIQTALDLQRLQRERGQQSSIRSLDGPFSEIGVLDLQSFIENLQKAIEGDLQLVMTNSDDSRRGIRFGVKSAGSGRIGNDDNIGAIFLIQIPLGSR